jgi:phosphoribosylaminoimidazolecarboxamide formyltransferase/IMP cyclohydrolase
MPIALLSVSDKRALVDLSRALGELGWTLVASGGTAGVLRESGLAVREVAELTGAPEMLGGRVKTLHPAIHAGILARSGPADAAELARHGIQPIELVICNLYPFREVVAGSDVSLAEAVEHIDIGGVTLLRAAAKNFERVTVLCDPDDYQPVLAELRRDVQVSAETRRRLAVKAFAHTRDYDTAIAAHLECEASIGDRGSGSGPDAQLPASLHLSLPLAYRLRYGENPHQAAVLYADPKAGPLGGQLLQGKALSYNNLLDLDAAWAAAQSFEDPTIVIVKHLSPCGIASAERLAAAFPAALACDPVSAFGGVIAANRAMDCAITKEMNELFVEAVIAPGFTDDALECFARYKPKCRLVAVPTPAGDAWTLRSVAGGLLVQGSDPGDPPGTEWRAATQRAPGEEEMAALRFAWRACQHVKSNAIVLARGQATVGIGGGLPSRVDAAKLAVAKAGERAQGAVMASDAFFPFPDAVEVAAEAGVTAVVQPGGSLRDNAVVEAADRLGLAMVLTGVRHFRH